MLIQLHWRTAYVIKKNMLCWDWNLHTGNPSYLRSMTLTPWLRLYWCIMSKLSPFRLVVGFAFRKTDRWDQWVSDRQTFVIGFIGTPFWCISKCSGFQVHSSFFFNCTVINKNFHTWKCKLAKPSLSSCAGYISKQSISFALWKIYT